MIAATNNLILAYDNLSSIPEWLSDAFCRISTGGGTSVRSLYTDDDEVIFDVKRPLVLTGITAVIERDDLRDRALILKLPTIPEHARRDEAAVEAELEAVLPQVLGALLTAVSTAMRRLPGVRLPRLPRMADFARLATAAEPALGLPEGAFLTIYDKSRAEAIADSVDLSPVAKALRDFAPEATGPEAAWKGTASELLTTLTSRVGEQVSRAKGWPTTPRTLSADLTRWQPALRQAGIMVERVKSGHEKTRNILIWRAQPAADAANASGRSADAGAEPYRPQANSGRDVGLWHTTSAADAADAKPPLSSLYPTDEDLEERRAIEEQDQEPGRAAA